MEFYSVLAIKADQTQESENGIFDKGLGHAIFNCTTRLRNDPTLRALVLVGTDGRNRLVSLHEEDTMKSNETVTIAWGS